METKGIIPWLPRSRQREGGLSIWEAEHCLDVELFLNEYPRWNVRGQHHPFILQWMFIHPAKSVWKEAERLIHYSCQQGLPRLDSKADVSAILLAGYRIPMEEIDIYHQVYALKRLPGLPPCGPKHGMRGNEGHYVFLERLPKVEERAAVRRKWRTGACWYSSIPPL